MSATSESVSTVSQFKAGTQISEQARFFSLMHLTSLIRAHHAWQTQRDETKT